MLSHNRLHRILFALICVLSQYTYSADATFADIKYYKGNYSNTFQREATYDEVTDGCLPPGDFPNGLSQYVIFSGIADGAGQSAGARFMYVPTEEQSFLAIYFSCLIVNLPDGHDPAYQYIHVLGPSKNLFGCEYYYKVGMVIPNPFGIVEGNSCGRTRPGTARDMAVMCYDLSSYIGDTITIEVLANSCSNIGCWSTIRLAMAALDTKQILCANQVYPDITFSAPENCQSYQWHRGNKYGPVVGTEKDFVMHAEQVDNYYCQIATDCGSTFYTACEIINPVADVFVRNHCDRYEFFNKSFLIAGEKKKQPDWVKWTIDDTIHSMDFDIDPITFAEGEHYFQLQVGSD